MLIKFLIHFIFAGKGHYFLNQHIIIINIILLIHSNRNNEEINNCENYELHYCN